MTTSTTTRFQQSSTTETAKADDETPVVPEALINLRAAIADSQQIIRAYDTKAQILAAFLGVIVGAVHLALTSTAAPQWVGLCGHLAMATGLIGILVIGAVLFPRSDPHGDVNLSGYTPTRVFYPVSDKAPDFTLSTYVSRAHSTQWLWELSYEMLKIVSVRKRKCRLLQWALIISAITVVLASFPLVM